MQVTVTTQTKITYKFNELSDDAKDAARDWYRTDLEFCWADEWRESLKGFCDHFPAAARDWSISTWSYSYVEIESTESDDVNELTGIRLWKWLNNTGHFNAKTLSGEYPLTGFYGDELLLDPIREFRDRPNSTTTLPELMQACGDAWLMAYIAEWEYSYSDEAVDENIICNEYDFDEDGKFTF